MSYHGDKSQTKEDRSPIAKSLSRNPRGEITTSESRLISSKRGLGLELKWRGSRLKLKEEEEEEERKSSGDVLQDRGGPQLGVKEGGEDQALDPETAVWTLHRST
ncbi:hypothetical protein RRG08_002437 [Elysia crispata]|uniref:Uncharacterized protein n=1 Tax=Elysia crispata TaxID=231223 RepID=A0AAE1A9B3_9GAST|nr:hypothetical protein RRG08_002437 [Elysia crispata]